MRVKMYVKKIQSTEDTNNKMWFEDEKGGKYHSDIRYVPSNIRLVGNDAWIRITADTVRNDTMKLSNLELSN